MTKWIFLFLPLLGVCQSKQKISLPNGYWVTPRLEIGLKDSSAFFLEANSRFQFEENYDRIYRSYLELGYNQTNNKIQLGISGKYISSNRQYFFGKINLKHLGRAFKHDIIKSINMEYLHEFEDDNPNTVSSPLGRWSIEMTAQRIFKNGLGYALGFRSFQIFSLNKENKNLYQGRWFDLGRFQLSFLYQLSKKDLLDLFLMKETNYYWIAAQTPEHALNQNRYILGLKYTHRIKPHDDN